MFDRLTARIAARLEEIDALKASGQDVWPTIPFADIARGQVTEAQRELIKRRGLRRYQGPFFSRTGAGVGQRNARVSRPQPFR